MTDADVFTCPLTGFSLRRPMGWSFLPSVDAPLERDATRDGARVVQPARRARLESGSTPIMVLTRPHGSARHVDPTVQLFRRFLVGRADLAALARLTAEQLPQALAHCTVRELTTDAILCGRRAVRYLVDYTLRGEAATGEPDVVFRCRCLGHIVTHGPYALTLTLASSTSKRYRYDDDLRAVLVSAAFA